MPAKKCLVVDDEPAIRSYLVAVLQIENFTGIEAENAPQAFRTVQELEGRLDLVITDLKMPGDMDGLDLAYSIRNAYPTIPIILMSGFARDEPTNLEFAFIPKPFKMQTILETVRSVAGKE